MSLKPKGYRPRLIEKDIKESLKIFGGVCIEGPKWCGKTWVGLNESNSSFMVEDTDEYGQRNSTLAKTNLHLALIGEDPHLIDEWQDVPEIWDAVRSHIDRDGKKGQFILTGSSTPKVQKPAHSGTGRITHIRMGTMTLYESGESTGSISLSELMDGKDIGLISEPVSLDHLVDLTMGGGWPGNLDIEYGYRPKSVDGYLRSIIHDAAEMDGIRRKESSLWLVVRSLARNECTLASNTKIHNDTGVPLVPNGTMMLDKGGYDGSEPSVSYDSVTGYIDVLERMFLISNQPAFDPNLKSSVRVGKRVKRHFTDPALAISALGASKERLLKDLKTFGFMFEALCERDLRIYAEYLGGRLYHYRDDSGREVDSIIEMADGTWAALEIKLGAGQIDTAAENLKEFRDAMERNGADTLPSVLCVICGLTEHAYRRNDGVYVIPITSLRP